MSETETQETRKNNADNAFKRPQLLSNLIQGYKR